MGHLNELVKLNVLVRGTDELDAYIKNTKYFTSRYQTQSSDKDILNVVRSKIVPGQFYFFEYLHDSNWFRYSPVFVIDYKVSNGLTILRCINMNFLPLKFRVALFDPYLREHDFENYNFVLKTKYDVVEKELLKFRYNFALKMYNVGQIIRAYRISINFLPIFLYSGHVDAKYDPGQLKQIWDSQNKVAEQREKEMMSATMDDYTDLTKDISGKFDVLKNDVMTFRNSLRKYGKS